MRNVSDVFKRAIFASETDEVFLALVQIDHPSLAAPIRVTSDGVDTVVGADTYVSFPFDLILPDDADDRPPVATLRIDNVDRTIVETIRSITSPPTVTIRVVLASDPTVTEVEFSDFELRDVQYDALVVEGRLTLESFLDEPYPGARFDPSRFPGLF